MACLGAGGISPAAAQGAGGLGSIYNNAQRALQNGENEKAVDLFKQFISIAGEMKEASILNSLDSAYYGLGAAYFNAKQYAEAGTALIELLKKFPKSNLVPEVQFFAAQCFFFQDDFQKAMDAFKITEANPKFRDDSLLFQAECARKLGRPSEAAEPLGKLTEGGIRSGNAARGALQLAMLAAEQQDGKKAAALLVSLSANLRVLPNVAAFNQAVILIGDALLNNGKQSDSLEVYRLLRDKTDVLELQDRQIATLKSLVAARQRQAKATTPDKAGEWLGDAARLQILLDEITKSKEEYAKSPDIRGVILLRLAKAYYETGRKWEALTAYDELLLRYPNGEEAEHALYGAVVTSSEVHQYARAQQLADQFVAEFPKSDRLDEVRYLKGATALENNDPEGAVTILTELLQASPDTKFKEETAYMIGNARFVQAKYAEARADYETFLKAFPESPYAQEVAYRMPLCLVFDGQYEKAVVELQDFIAKNADSPYVPDAQYRLMVCYYASALNDKTGKQYKQLVSLTSQFESKYADSPQLGDVLALRGDALAGLGALPGQSNQDEEAAAAYLQSFKISANEETQNYSIFEAIKLWQKNGAWEKIEETLVPFVKDQPDHPSASTAKWWIGRALLKQRKEAEAKQYYATEIKRDMTQPRKEGVEMMIRELATTLGRKKRPAPPAPEAAVAGVPATPTVAVATEPTEPAKDPDVELEELLGGEDTLKNRTATARLFLAKALLAENRRDLGMRDTYYEQLAEFQPSELSAFLLGQMAEYALRQAEEAHRAGQEDARAAALAKGESFCKEILSSYPQSEFLEFGYIGHGQIALARGQWEPALRWFKEAIDVAAAGFKLKDATFGQARALLELGKYDEAKKLFEQVASTREWRGETTAESLYYLGETEFRQQRYKEANAFYQRVFVGYQRYPEIMGRAYLRSAASFEKLGEKKDASNTIGALILNEKVPASYREQGRALLKEWGIN